MTALCQHHITQIFYRPDPLSDSQPTVQFL